MPARSQERPRPRAVAILVLGIQFLILVACCAHAGRRAWKDAHRSGDQGTWPARQSVLNFEWIERRVRAAGAVGHVHVGTGEPDEYNVAKVQNAIVPAVLHLEERDLSIVTFPRAMDREHVRAELRARGFAHAKLRPKSNVGLAARASLPQASDAYPVATGGTKARGLLLLSLVVLLTALVAARRGGAQAFLAMLLVAPFALGLASAAGDATGSPAAVTTLVWVLLCGACIPLFACWRSEVAPAQGWRPPPTPPRATAWFGAAAFAIAALGIVLATLSFGILPDGGVDAFRMYNLRARFIVRAAEFGAPFTTEGYLLTTHADYPPLIPFAVAGAHRLLGGTSALAPIWVQGCAWVGGTGLIVLWTLRVAGRLPALTLLALLACNPFWVRSLAEQVCDVPLALLIGAALVALRGAMSRREHSRHAALVCGVFLGLALLVKNEASLVTLVLGLSVAGWCSVRWRERRVLLGWLALGLAPFLALALAFESISPVNDLVELSRWSDASFERAALIAGAFARVVFDPMLFKGTLLVVTVAALAAAPGRIRDTLRGAAGARGWELCVSVALLGVTAGLFLVYLTTPHDLAWHLATSVNRVFAQGVPAAAMLGVSIAGNSAEPRTEPESGRGNL